MTDARSTDAARPDPGPDAVETGVEAPSSPTDRPYVDGTASSPEELRAEVRRLSNEERQHVDELREEVGDSIAELAARLDVKTRVAVRRDEAVAAVHQQVGRARVAATEGASVAKDTARERPGLVAGVAAVLLALLVIVLRRRWR